MKTSPTSSTLLLAPTLAPQAGGPLRLPTLIRRWLLTWRSRRQLSRLSLEHLRDVGLTRRHVEEEVQRPFWDCPDYCKRL